MALLEPQVDRIGRPDGAAFDDRAPDSLATGTPEPLRSALPALPRPDRGLTRATDLGASASAASPSRLFPKAVVMAREVSDVTKVFDHARRTGTPATFRSG